jgi:hypothetical protein
MTVRVLTKLSETSEKLVHDLVDGVYDAGLHAKTLFKPLVEHIETKANEAIKGIESKKEAAEKFNETVSKQLETVESVKPNLEVLKKAYFMSSDATELRYSKVGDAQGKVVAKFELQECVMTTTQEWADFDVETIDDDFEPTFVAVQTPKWVALGSISIQLANVPSEQTQQAPITPPTTAPADDDDFLF